MKANISTFSTLQTLLEQEASSSILILGEVDLHWDLEGPGLGRGRGRGPGPCVGVWWGPQWHVVGWSEKKTRKEDVKKSSR